MARWKLFVLVLVVAVTAVACSKQEEPVVQAPPPAPVAGQPEMPASHPPLDEQSGQQGMVAPAGPRQVVVPGDVQAAWKSVVLAVTNRATGTTQDVTIDIGQSAAVEGLEITVENFVPHFSMGSGTITSASNDTVNPAAKLVVTEGETEVFSGWLFSLYPEAHPFQHETYGIVLKDFKEIE